MSDKIVRAMALNGNVRIFVAKTTNLVQRAHELHGTYPAASAALGRTLSIGAIMGTTLKNDDEKLVIEIRGDGELGQILVNADNKGFVRGLVSNPYVHKVNSIGKLDVGGSIGHGTLRVTHDVLDGMAFSSQVELQSGEIGDDFAYYYAQSEQIPSAVSVGVLVNEDLSIKSAGAILIQVLPSATEEDISEIEKTLAQLPPVSNLMIDQEAIEVCVNLFNDVLILETTDTQYYCGCNKEQMTDVLRTLSTDELKELIAEDQGAVLECHYCHSKYTFDEAALREIISERQKN